MKAAVVVGNNDIRYMDIAEPVLGPGEVKIAVYYCGVCGSDIPRVLNGTCHSFPQVLGHEFSGIITEVAENVTSVCVGDHVVGIPLVPCMECEDCKNGYYSLCKHYSFVGSRQQGAMAEYVVVPETNVYKIDKDIRLDYAVLFEPSTVALHGILINNFNPKETDKVCVFGAGTIALLTIQWCKLLGANNITAIIRSKDRVEAARKYGADNVLSTLDDDCIEKAMKLTNNKGFNYVLDAAGTGESIQTSLMVAGNKSNVCLIGTPSKPIEFSVNNWEIINRKEMHLTGSWMSYSAPWPGIEWSNTAKYMSMGKLLLGPELIHSVIPLCEVKNVFNEFMINRKSIKGRVVLEIRPTNY